MTSPTDNQRFERRPGSSSADRSRSTAPAASSGRLGIFPTVALVVAGSLLGVVITVGVSTFGRKPTPKAPALAEDPAETPGEDKASRSRRPFVSAPVPVIEPGQATPSGPAPGALPDQRSPAEARAALHAQFDQAVKAHQAEPVDARWAPATKQVLTSYIQQLPSKLGVRAIDTDCRSKSCLVTLEWNSRDRASATFVDVLRSPLELECERTILFPPHTDSEPGGASFRGRMLVNCPNQRS